MRIKNFTEFKLYELNHQNPNLPVGVNDTGFGQGAHVGNWGVNYGNPSAGVAGTFGRKGAIGDPHLKRQQQNPTSPTGVYDPVEDVYLLGDDVDKLLLDYTVACRQNSEEPQTFDNITSNVIKFIRNYLNEKD